MKTVEQVAKTIIVKSGLPDADYVVNPYTGCSFACSYCYASFMGRFVGEPREAWGDYVYVKTNAVDLFRKEIGSKRFELGLPSLFLSSVTDAWQGPERKYRLARGILEALVERRYAGRVSILTKSPLLLRDVDLLSRLPNVEVGVTITTDDDEMGRIYEARAPKNSMRLDVLRELSSRSIPSYAFVGPLMTHYVDEPAKIDRLLAALAAAGVRFIYAELLNVAPNLLRRFRATIAGSEDEVERFVAAQIEPARRAALSELVERLAQKHQLELRLGRVLDHAADRQRERALTKLQRKPSVE